MRSCLAGPTSRRHRLLPAPRRGQRSWREFVRQHAEQILAVDFFTVETVWLQRLHVLFFLEIGSRCVHLTGCTASPTGAWVVQQARQLAWLLQDGKIQARFLVITEGGSLRLAEATAGKGVKPLL